MINEIIELLPSADLKEKIRETNHQFQENELLQIIDQYAPTLDSKLDLLERFSAIASPDIAALAKVFIQVEKESFQRFVEVSEGFVYELHIKETPNDADECYICASYNAALACIDRYYEEYAEIGSKETEQSRYEINKRKLFSENDVWADDVYADCILGANKIVLEITDYKKRTNCRLDAVCSECTEICSFRCDNVNYPCFACNYALIKYRDYDGKERFGVNLCINKCDGFASEFYVIELDSSIIQEHCFDDYFYDHTHIALPLATIASPEELDETMRKNYYDFVEFMKARQQ